MVRSSIIGATGYAGAELVALLASHADVEIAGLFGSDARLPKEKPSQCPRFDEVCPRFRGQVDAPIQPTSIDRVLADQPDAVFLATPHEVSHDLVPGLLAEKINVFDLSAAFRLRDAAAYPAYYGFAHEHSELLTCAAYGLPERFAEEISTANLIAVPGCYPTSIILPMAPLIDAGVIDQSMPVIADSTSGVSGAGRSPSLKSLFCEVSYQPYGVFSHRHTPEINQYCGRDVVFTPHVAPFDRGLVSTIHATLSNDCDESGVRAILHEAYGDSAFIRLLPAGSWPSVNAVRSTNFCDIALAVRTQPSQQCHLIVVSAVDNLLKGAAGQAVQCFNIRFGFPEESALLPAARKELTNVHA